MSKFRLESWVSVAAVFLFLTAGSLTVPVWAKAAPNPAPSPTPVKVRIGSVGSLSDSGIFIAMDRGYFKEQNLDVEFVKFSRSSKAIVPMSRGDIEVGGGSLSAGLFNAILRGIPLRVVADKGTNSPGHGFAALVVRKDLYDTGSIRSYKDLKGHKVAVSSPGGGSQIQMEQALAKGGLTVKDVDLVGLSHSNQVAAYGNNAIDASILLEPLVTKAVADGLVVKLAGADEFFPAAGAVILYAPHFVEKMPDAARRWMVAYLKGVRDYNAAFGRQKTNQDEIVSILTRRTSVKDAALYEKMVVPGLNPNGTVKSSDVALILKWYRDHDKVKEALDLNRFFDMQFVEYAVKQLGPAN